MNLSSFFFSGMIDEVWGLDLNDDCEETIQHSCLTLCSGCSIAPEERETRHMFPDRFDLSRLVGHLIICPALGSCKWLYKADIDCQVGKVSKPVNTMRSMHLHIPDLQRVAFQLNSFRFHMCFEIE